MEGSATIQSALQTAFSGIQSDIINTLIVVVPVAIVLFGAMYGIKWAKKGFKAAAN